MEDTMKWEGKKGEGRGRGNRRNLSTLLKYKKNCVLCFLVTRPALLTSPLVSLKMRFHLTFTKKLTVFPIFQKGFCTKLTPQKGFQAPSSKIYIQVNDKWKFFPRHQCPSTKEASVFQSKWTVNELEKQDLSSLLDGKVRN